MRLTQFWKPACVVLVLVAAAIYTGLVVDDISRGVRLGEERRTRANASRSFVAEEAMIGTIWAHEHHPHDASWCPDYSPSFHKGCAGAVAGGFVHGPAPPP